MKKSIGQYLTTSERLQAFVYDHVRNRNQRLLEPSFGKGHLLQSFLQENSDYPMVCCELDNTLEPIVSFGSHQRVIYGDFLQQSFEVKFATIVGNPPYVKQRKGNLYIQFIEQCFLLLEDHGELLFIVPSDFLKSTRSSAILTEMDRQGSFTDFLFPHDEHLFEGASVDVVVFRYEKGKHDSTTRVNGETRTYSITNGILTFSRMEGTRLKDLFDVYVGLVSGKDEVFCSEHGNMNVLTKKNRTKRFIYSDVFPTGISAIDDHLLSHKETLIKRRIRKFNESNWHQWGAPRNKKVMEEHYDKPCIYMLNLTRQQDVAFLGKVQYFGGNLLCLIPKHPLPMEKLVAYFCSPDFQSDYIFSGRFKIGHKQLCNVCVDIGLCK